MGKKDKELAARRKAYFERYGTQSQIPIPAGMTLPPGFVNLGNSCFLNSTLQSLTATPLLHSLLTFTPPPDVEHDQDLYPARSPAMTNARGPPGVRRGWEAGMPISDAFLRFEDEAINARQTGKTSLSPRDLLGQIGAKYDQYTGYRQQDAHELLRHLLDGMRMEEMDIIKKRNPQPPKSKPKPKLSRPNSLENSSSTKPGSLDALPVQNGSSDPAGPIPEDPPMPFADMVFGGTLASILVCEGCKHISHTYEDFMDLSLSIKPEDAREKKSNKFKFFHKFRKSTTPLPTRTPPPTMANVQTAVPFPSTEVDVASAAAPNNPSTVDMNTNGINGSGAPNGLAVGGTGDDRRGSAGSTTGLAISDGEIGITQPRTRVSSVQISTGEGHDRDESTSVGARLGRRVSLQGWKKKDKNKEKSKERNGDKKDKDKDNIASNGKEAGEDKDLVSKTGSRPPSPTLGTRQVETNLSSAPMSRATSPSRKNEVAYLRKVLADAGAPPPNPLALLKGAADGLGMLKDPFSRPSLDDVWLKLGTGRGSISDALRSFTAVEILEGDNAFACRRCWKIAHGIPVGRARKAALAANGTGIKGKNGQRSKESVGTAASDSTYESSSDSDCDSDSSSEDEGGTRDSPQPLQTIGVPLRPASTSGLGAGPEQWARSTILPRPSSAPMVEEKALSNGLTMSIPIIEMTSPDAERARPFPDVGSPPPVLKRTTTQGSTETGSSAMTLESVQSTAGTSIPGLTIAAPVPRTPIALRSTTLPGTSQNNVNAALTAIPRSQQYIHRRALKRYLIATPPPVLVIHLKRFQQVAGAGSLLFGSLRKLDDFVAFPEVLDIAPFVAPNREEYGMGRAKKPGGGRVNRKSNVGGSGPHGTGWFGRGKEKEKAVKYRLYAVVVHIGSMLGGHYIAYIALPPVPPVTPEGEDPPAGTEDPAPPKDKDLKDKEALKDGKDKEKDKEKRQWVYISDATVRPVSFEEVSKTKAYLCFYERFYE